MEQDHYSILGVTPKAEPAEIRAAYRALMRIYHPDADRSSEAADRARQINAAYSVLNNPERRASYDDSLAEHRRIRFEPVAAQAVLGPRRFPYGAAFAIFIARPRRRHDRICCLTVDDGPFGRLTRPRLPTGRRHRCRRRLDERLARRSQDLTCVATTGRPGSSSRRSSSARPDQAPQIAPCSPRPSRWRRRGSSSRMPKTPDVPVGFRSTSRPGSRWTATG